MTTKRWNVFYDHEKEEKWLNEMVAKGLAMTNYRFYRYTFEECSRGEYIYRIEFLKNPVTHTDSIKYIQFMEDNGAKHIASITKWVYFRKKSADGPFEIYSDLESRIAHCQRVVRRCIYFGLIMLFSILSVIPSIVEFIGSGFQNASSYIFKYSTSGTVHILGIVLFFRLLLPYTRKLKMLKRERNIRE